MTAGNVLRGLPTPQLEKFAAEAQPSWVMPIETADELRNKFSGLFWIGTFIGHESTEAGYDLSAIDALHAGADRLVVSVVDWLQSPEARLLPHTPATLKWLGELECDEVTGPASELLDDLDATDPDTLCIIERELAGYDALIAAGETIEATSFEASGLITSARTERLGSALAAVTLTRVLASAEVTADLDTWLAGH
jgi:hypothetical protein